jgi:hypothetical protein
MKNLLSTLVILLIGIQVSAQVGIGTTQPTSTLDVNGTLRVRSMDSLSSGHEALRLIGLDQDGFYVPVKIGENVILENNVLKAVESQFGFGDSEIATVGVVHNLRLIILPGEPNDDKKVIRIVSSVGNIDVTGIEAGLDGQTVWIMARDGNVRLRGQDVGSDPENRFLFSGNLQLQQYDLVQIVYDGTLQRWVVMDF